LKRQDALLFRQKCMTWFSTIIGRDG